MKKLITEDNTWKLGFLEWVPSSPAFGGEGVSLGRIVDLVKLVICLAQWVVLSKRFGVQRIHA